MGAVPATGLLPVACWCLAHCMPGWVACWYQELSSHCRLSSCWRRCLASAVQAEFTNDEREPVTKQLFEDGLGLAGLELLDAGKEMAAFSASPICCNIAQVATPISTSLPLQASSCWSRTLLSWSHPSKILQSRASECVARER